MKPSVRNLMIAGAVALAASSASVAQTSSSQIEQWYHAKYGRPSPTEAARIAAERENTAYREVAPTQDAAPVNASFEALYRAKYGRPSPTKESRIVAEQATTAYREVQSTEAQSPRSPDKNVENRRMFLDARAPDLPPRYSASEIKKMIHDAKAPDDFRRLADYFDFRAMEFDQKAQVQLKELQRLLALSYHARSYATHVDNTRELIKRYKVQSQECSARATAYRARSTLNTETK